MSLPSLADWFPIEIYGSIISFVAGQDDASMSFIKSCALVSHDFLSLARDHLFDHIWLSTRRGHSESFVRLILRTPEIAQHIRSLSYHVKASEFAIEGLADALGMCTRLHCLLITGHYDYYYEKQIPQHLEWSEVPLSLRVELLHRPTLTRLYLAHIRNFDLSDLTMCWNLKALDIENVTFASVAIQKQKKALQLKQYSPTLDENGITNQLCTARSADGAHIIDFGVLQTVELGIERDISQSLKSEYQVLFKRCTQVTRVIAVVDPQEEYTSNPLPLQGFADMILPSLQSLQHLEVAFFGPKLDDYGLAAELDVISGKNVIESIEISVLYSLQEYHALDDEWIALDGVLTRDPSKWKNLKTVSLKFSIHEWACSDISKALIDLPKNQLKGLVASKVIHFVFEVDDYSGFQN